jgi:hypothetical protein
MVGNNPIASHVRLVLVRILVPVKQTQQHVYQQRLVHQDQQEIPVVLV